MPPVRAAGVAARVSRRPASGGHSASRSSPCGRVAGRWPARPATIADRTTRTPQAVAIANQDHGRAPMAVAAGLPGGREVARSVTHSVTPRSRASAHLQRDRTGDGSTSSHAAARAGPPRPAFPAFLAGAGRENRKRAGVSSGASRPARPVKLKLRDLKARSMSAYNYSPKRTNAAKLFARDHLRKNRCTTPKAGLESVAEAGDIKQETTRRER